MSILGDSGSRTVRARSSSVARFSFKKEPKQSPLLQQPQQPEPSQLPPLELAAESPLKEPVQKAVPKKTFLGLHSLHKLHPRKLFAHALGWARSTRKLGKPKGPRVEAQPVPPSQNDPAKPPRWKAFVSKAETKIVKLSRIALDIVFTAAKKPAILVASLLLVFSLAAGANILIAANNFPLPTANAILPDEDSAQKALMDFVSPDQVPSDATSQSALPPLPLSLKVQNYAVRPSDSIASIAKRFGLRQDTIISMNGLKSASSIRSGLTLRIPNMDGVNRIVRGGESLQGIARSFGVEVSKIADANDLKTASLYSGQNLFIPYARLSSYELKNFYGERFSWPARGIISSPFGFRLNPFSGLRTFHSAIDIAIPLGTPVRATMDGVVADTGYNSVFGNYIILRHSGGYQSLYGHLEAIGVRRGQSVSQGQVIGHSGNTGESTGPHLHFSIFKNGVAVNPISYVK